MAESQQVGGLFSLAFMQEVAVKHCGGHLSATLCSSACMPSVFPEGKKDDIKKGICGPVCRLYYLEGEKEREP